MFQQHEAPEVLFVILEKISPTLTGKYFVKHVKLSLVYQNSLVCNTVIPLNSSTCYLSIHAHFRPCNRSSRTYNVRMEKLKTPRFRQFLEKYATHPVPDESTMRKHYPRVQQITKGRCSPKVLGV